MGLLQALRSLQEGDEALVGGELDIAVARRPAPQRAVSHAQGVGDLTLRQSSGVSALEKFNDGFRHALKMRADMSAVKLDPVKCRTILSAMADEALDRRICEDDLWVMANIYPADSGLPMTIWVRPRSNERHGPRIKVCTVHGNRMLPDQTVTVTLPTILVIPPGGLSASDLFVVGDWIRLNEEAITAHWDGQISSIEFARRLRKLP